MNRELKNMEKRFKEAFEEFEGDVDPKIWKNVQQSLNASGVGSSGTVASKGLWIKSIALKITTGLLALSIVSIAYYLYPREEKKEKNEVEENIVVDQEEIFSIDEETNKKVEPLKIKKETQKLSVVKERKIEVSEEGAETEAKTVSESSIPLSQSFADEDREMVKEIETEREESLNDNVVEESEELEVKIVVNLDEGEAPFEVEFSAKSNRGVHYFWDFNDGTPISNLESEFHTFYQPGEYKVSLKVIDSDANIKEDYRIIRVRSAVEPSFLEEIPNVFSPNGDGFNDEIKIEGRNIDKIHAVVMDPNGKKVYEWKNMDEGWNGRDFSGNKLPAGIYYINVVAYGADGKSHTPGKAVTLRE